MVNRSERVLLLWCSEWRNKCAFLFDRVVDDEDDDDYDDDDDEAGCEGYLRISTPYLQAAFLSDRFISLSRSASSREYTSLQGAYVSVGITTPLSRARPSDVNFIIKLFATLTILHPLGFLEN